MMAAKAAAETYYVRCADYTAGPFKSHESAERALAGIEAFGACPKAHTVTEEAAEVREM